MISRRGLLRGSLASLGTIFSDRKLQSQLQQQPKAKNDDVVSVINSPASPTERVAVLNGLRITLDGSSGALLRLGYPGVATLLDTSGKLAGMLSVAYPTPRFQPLRLESRLSRATIDIQDRCVTLNWERLEPTRKEFDYDGQVSARVVLTALPDERSIVWQCEIVNHTSLPVPQVLFPDLRGLRAFDGVPNTSLHLPGAVIQPFEGDVPPATGAETYYTVGVARYELPLQWFNFGSLRGGFSLFPRRWGWKEPSYELLSRRTEANPEQLSLYWDNLPSIQPGETWKSYEYWMTPHTGGWAKGIDVYRSFVRESMAKRPALPTTVRDGLAFWSPWMTEKQEKDPAHAAFRFADLPDMGREAAQYGVSQIVPWRWNEYSQFPFTVNRMLGTEKDFLDGVKAIKSMGIGVSPFISIMLARENIAARYGLTVNKKDDWTYDPDFIPRFRPGYATGNIAVEAGPTHPVWVSDTKEIFQSWFRKGICSLSWDQFLGSQEVVRKLIDLFRGIRSEARACDPQSAFSGENYVNYEEVGEILDFTWNWRNYSDGWQTVTSVLPYPRLNANVQNSPLDVKKAFMNNIYMNLMPKHPDRPNGTAWIHDFPELGSALKECTGLRHRFLSYFTQGNFSGSSVLANSSQAHVVGYQCANSLLLIGAESMPRTADDPGRGTVG